MEAVRGVALRHWRPPARLDVAATAQRLEPAVTALAIFLAPLRNLHPSELFFTLSDFIFCLSLVLLAAGRRVPRAPHEGLGLLWLAGWQCCRWVSSPVR
jgi:hypothetical protein